MLYSLIGRYNVLGRVKGFLQEIFLLLALVVIYVGFFVVVGGGDF